MISPNRRGIAEEVLRVNLLEERGKEEIYLKKTTETYSCRIKLIRRGRGGGIEALTSLINDLLEVRQSGRGRRGGRIEVSSFPAKSPYTNRRI